MADHTRVYTTAVSSSEVLDMAEAYLVGLRGFSVPWGHEPTPNSAEFRLRGGLLGAMVGGHPTARLTAEERGAKTLLTITANREQLLEALDAWASSELGATIFDGASGYGEKLAGTRSSENKEGRRE